MNSRYPSNWEEIAWEVKERSNHRCEICEVEDSHDPCSGECLTVHHLDANPANNDPSNLVALCQRCHLRYKPIVTNLPRDRFLFGIRSQLPLL